MMRRVSLGGALAILALLVSLSVAAMAQDNGTNAAPQGRRGQRGQGRQVTLAMIPVSALETELKLTADQKTKLTTIQSKYQDDAKALQPAPGTPPDPANRQKLMDLTRQANQDMEVVLNDEQKGKLPETLRQFSTVRAAGIPLEVYSDLKLTDDQKKQIADIAKDSQEKIQALSPEERRTQGRDIRRATRDKIQALLTADQKAVIAKYNQEHPRGRRAGGNNNA